MAKQYAIWDKVSPVICPSGEVFTAEEWMNRYPAARLEHITVICSAGEINGGFYGTLGQLTEMYEAVGCDFSDCTTPEEKLERIEEFDAEREAAMAEAVAEPTAEERIAAALEYQVMSTLPDEEETIEEA